MSPQEILRSTPIGAGQSLVELTSPYDRRVRVIVTGGNSGVGKATAAALAADGHSVMIACRTNPKAEQAAATMTGDAGSFRASV
jgi:shikimate 5-dehydrogenase